MESGAKPELTFRSAGVFLRSGELVIRAPPKNVAAPRLRGRMLRLTGRIAGATRKPRSGVISVAQRVSAGYPTELPLSSRGAAALGSRMNRRELIEAVFEEMQRIFGFEKYPSTIEEHEWLAERYDISLEEHRRYELIDHNPDELDQEENDEFSMAFVRNDKAVCRFLEGLLRKYRSGSEVYRDTAG